MKELSYKELTFSRTVVPFPDTGTEKGKMLFGNGDISFPVVVQNPGTLEVVFFLAGTPKVPAAFQYQFNVIADGETQTLSVPLPYPEPTKVKVLIPFLTPGQKTVTLQWTNDYYIQNQFDANLIVFGAEYEMVNAPGKMSSSLLSFVPENYQWLVWPVGLLALVFIVSRLKG